MSKKKKLRLFILLVLLFSNSFLVQGQDSYIKDRWNIKISGSPEIRNRRYIPLFAKAQVNYGFGNFVEAGLAIGVQRYYAFNQRLIDDMVIISTSEPHIAPTYALNANLHLLPLIAKRDDFRFDLYATGKFEGQYHNKSSSVVRPLKEFVFYKAQWNYFLGGGAAFYFSKRIGVYTEYGFQKDLRYDWMGKRLYLGVSLKF
jgi:hypothetical protein